MKKYNLKYVVVASVILLTSNFAYSAPQCSGYFTSVLSESQKAQVQMYLEDTVLSLDKMRGSNFLLSDTTWIKNEKDGGQILKTLNDNTSPTNIAVDLLIQSDLALRPNSRVKALKTLANVFTTLDKLEFHKDTGLLFSRYKTDNSSRVSDLAVSSIDNFHLAIALWTVKEAFPKMNIGKIAKRLFDRMNFSIYVNPEKGVVGGNLRHENGKWIKEAYNFDDFGSEARGLYSAGWAIGLFKDLKYDSNFPKAAMASVSVEIMKSEQGNILKLWDGSAFQLYFPKMFISEQMYSEKMQGFYQAQAEYMIAEGNRRNLMTPAAHSAGWAALTKDGISRTKSSYRDKGGDIRVVHSMNNDVLEPKLRADWNATFAPNALMMAATSNTGRFLPILSKLENIKSKDNSLYATGLGWMDAMQVKGSAKGQVIPAQLSLNQGMLALALLQMQDPNGMGISSRQMYNNPIIRNRLQYFYDLFDRKISEMEK